MNFYDFSASVISSLAWPGCILLLLYYWPEPLRQLLEKISFVKFGNVEVKLIEKGIEQVWEQAGYELKVLQSFSKTSSADKYNGSDLIAKAEKLVPVSVESAVSMAWQAIELRALELLKQKQPEKPFQPPHSIMLMTTLRKQGLISNELHEMLREMRSLRNKVVHLVESSQSLSPQSASDYISVAKAILKEWA